MPDDPEPQSEPTFEQALSQLERIVANLEQGEPELTSALAKYEKGVSLLSQCYRLLDQAEQSVALLTGVDDAGTPVTAPFDAAATVARETTHRPPQQGGPCDKSSTGSGKHVNFHPHQQGLPRRPTTRVRRLIRRFNQRRKCPKRAHVPSGQ